MLRILCLIITSTNAIYIIPNTPETLSEIQEKYIGNLLKVYENYTFVFHAENASLDTMERIYNLYQKNVAQAALMYNCDASGQENIQRQIGARFSNLVILNDIFKFAKFSEDPGRMAPNDIVILFLYKEVTSTAMLKWILQGRHNIIGNVLVLNLTRSNMVTLNTTVYFSKNNNGKSVLLQETNKSNVDVPINLLLSKKFNNLSGHELLVGFIDYFPYILCVEYENITRILGNDEIRICRHAIDIIYNNYPEKTHSFIFDKVVERRVDFVVGGITRTYNRALRATITINHITEGYTLLYIFRISPWTHLLMFFHPFKWSLWLFIIATIFIMSWITHAIINYDSAVKKINFYRSFLATACIVIGQIVDMPERYLKRKPSLYILLTFWWFTCIWMNTYYTGKLSAIYVKPPHNEPTSLQEILNGGYKIAIDELQAGAISEIYQSDLMQNNARKTIYVKGMCPSIEYTLSSKAALLIEFGYAKYHSQIQCPDFIGPDKKLPYLHSSLRVVGTALVVIPHGWPLAKGTPYTGSINMVMVRLMDGGFIRKWKNQFTKSGRIVSIPDAEDNKAIRESNEQVSIILYVSAFLVLVLGYILSATAFLLELSYAPHRSNIIRIKEQF